MKKEVSHFWIGNFKSETEFYNFFGEDENYYADERDVDEKYISEFAKTQNKHWLDHDFIECGFENESITFEDKFLEYSYAEQWISELKNRIEQIKPGFEINSIAFVTKEKIDNPTSVKTPHFEMLYVGEIEYEI